MDTTISEALIRDSLSKQSLDSVKDLYGNTIFTQTSIITEKQDIISRLTDSIFKLKKPSSTLAYYQGRTSIGVKNKFIPFDTLYGSIHGSIPVDTPTESLPYIYGVGDSTYIPHTIDIDSGGVFWIPYYPAEDTLRARESSDHYNIDLSVTGNGVMINDISFPDSLDVRFVEKKGSLFKKGTTQVQFKHSNPYVQTLGSSSLIYKPKKKPRLLEKALLIGAGIFIGIKATK